MSCDLIVRNKKCLWRYSMCSQRSHTPSRRILINRLPYGRTVNQSSLSFRHTNHRAWGMGSLGTHTVIQKKNIFWLNFDGRLDL